MPIWKTVQRIPRALAAFDKLYIASVNGPAIGAGTDACAMADIRIASDRAKFAINHLRIGALSADGGYYYLTRLLGVAKTIELAVKFDVFDAAEALRIGFVSQVVAHDALPEATHNLATRLAGLAPIAVRHAKRLIYDAPQVSLDQHLDDAYRAMLQVASTEDFHEGSRAILEKRVPRYRGR